LAASSFLEWFMGMHTKSRRDLAEQTNLLALNATIEALSRPFGVLSKHKHRIYAHPRWRSSPRKATKGGAERRNRSALSPRLQVCF